MAEKDLITTAEIEDGIVVVTMQSPPVNALTVELCEALVTVVDGLHRSAARAVVLTGTGRNFCAGGDISRFQQLDSRDKAVDFVTQVQGMLDGVAAIPAPVIAAVNGFALGGGLELALACDIRVAGDGVRMGLPETRWGLLAGAGGTQRLARAVGPGAAKLMMYTAEPVTSAEALRIGLVDAVSASPDPLQDAIEIARKIAVNSPRAVRAVKRCVDEGLQVPLEDGLALERGHWADLIPDGDHLEGAASFFERRPPVFPSVNPGAAMS
ncbi:enoyl-CoA hydratase/isomerase family protein [Tomitella biformata]|uniref:enoyl-CoA hydratase/isomerase family protein n=1 Tax=Tomitella biformata TaxID=630403 RepID=UPI000463B65F|nr:enoyl-CoA hydratase-related protein [Tomitella biformata]